MTASALRSGSAAAPLVGTPTVAAAPTPADKPAQAEAQPPANRFAELLRRNRAEAPKAVAPAPTPTPTTTPQNEAGASAETFEPTTLEAKAAPANAAKARAATPKGATGKAAVDNSVASERTGDEAADDNAAAKPHASKAAPCPRTDAGATAAVAADALHRVAAAGTVGINDASGSLAGNRDAATGNADAARPTSIHARGMASVDAANESRSSLGEASRDPALRAAADADFQVQLADAGKTLDSVGTPPAHERAIDALTASLGAGTATRSAEPATATSATTALALPTPIDAPDFAAALGVRVSVLVQDGVQHAELHLNPAETGPVSIHISLDGTAARVDFGADLAATRAAIERGLPELASALSEAGFTLAGGGVSQHAGARPGGDDDAAASPRRFAIDGGAAVSLAARPGQAARRIAAGGVDLYA